MKINFTKNEYQVLLDMIKMADRVLNAHSISDEEFAATQQYRAISQKVISHAKEAGCEDRIIFDKKLEEYFATQDYDLETL